MPQAVPPGGRTSIAHCADLQGQQDRGDRARPVVRCRRVEASESGDRALNSRRDAQDRPRLQFQLISGAGIMARSTVWGPDPSSVRERSARGRRSSVHPRVSDHRQRPPVHNQSPPHPGTPEDDAVAQSLARRADEFLTQRHDHLWAIVFPDEVKWVREGYDAPLDHHVLDTPSPPAADRIEEVEPEEYSTQKVITDGRGLRVPADLDQSICRYLSLSPDDKKKFHRATFWLDTSRRQWTISASATFAAHVSAIEALTERGIAHQFKCPICGGHTRHEVPGATQIFKNFIETYAPEVGQASRKTIYDLRSDIVHGSELIELDNALAFGWDPLPLKQGNLLEDLSIITRVAMRNWLKSKSHWELANPQNEPHAPRWPADDARQRVRAQRLVAS